MTLDSTDDHSDAPPTARTTRPHSNPAPAVPWYCERHGHTGAQGQPGHRGMAAHVPLTMTRRLDPRAGVHCAARIDDGARGTRPRVDVQLLSGQLLQLYEELFGVLYGGGAHGRAGHFRGRHEWRKRLGKHDECPDDQFASSVSLYYDTIQYTVVSTALLCSGIAASSGRDPTGANSSILSNVATIPANELNVADQIAMGLGNGPAYPTGACAPGTSSLYNFACASSWGWGVCSEAFTAQCPPGYYLLQGLTGVSAGGTTCFANVNVICVQLSTTGAPGNGTISMATPQTSYNGTAQSSVCPGSSTVQSFGARGGCCQDSLKPQCAVPMVNCSGTPRSGGPFKLVTLACTMGSSCPANTTEPVPCPGGSFSNVTGATACTTCPPGKFAPARSTGQTACLVCAAGLNSTAGATVCTTRTPTAAPPSPPTEHRLLTNHCRPAPLRASPWPRWWWRRPARATA